jgi:hypothetical protein
MHYKRRSRRRGDYDWYETQRYYEKQAPAPTEVCNGKSRAKHKRPKKDKCPRNRVHEWYKETVTESGRYWWPYAAEPGMRVISRTYEKWTCIHCWKEKVKKPRHRTPRRRWGGGHVAKRYGYYLPKRPVQF